MPRQTITLSDPNHAWLQARVESGEFKTQTEAVNDALRRAREIESEGAGSREHRAWKLIFGSGALSLSSPQSCPPSALSTSLSTLRSTVLITN